MRGLDHPPGPRAGRGCDAVRIPPSQSTDYVTRPLSRRRLLIRSAAAACALLAACYHWAEVTTTWAGSGKSPIAFRHVVAVFASSNEPLRYAMENRLVGQFPNGEASYRALRSVDLDDPAAVRRALDAKAFDSAIIMSVVLADKRAFSFTAAVPAAHHPFPATMFADQWQRAWDPPFDPAFVPPNRLVAIELQIYSLTDDRLIWAGRGDPGDVKTLRSLGNAAVANLARELAREGLIAASLDGDGTRVAE
jgi:hypothetical protein